MFKGKKIVIRSGGQEDRKLSFEVRKWSGLYRQLLCLWEVEIE